MPMTSKKQSICPYGGKYVVSLGVYPKGNFRRVKYCLGFLMECYKAIRSRELVYMQKKLDR